MSDIPTHRGVGHRLVDGLVIGVAQAGVLILAIAIVIVVGGNQQQETLTQILGANQKVAGAVACSLSAPTKQIIQDDGTVQTLRPELFVNRVCLEALGFEAIDLDGDGKIEGGG